MKHKSGNAFITVLFFICVFICICAPGASFANSVQSKDGALTQKTALDIALPPGIGGSSMKVLQGDSMTKAKYKLQEIISKLPPLSYLQTAQTKNLKPINFSLKTERMYAQARILFLEGKDSKAIIYFQNMLKLHPRAEHVLYLLGKAYLASGDTGSGITFLKKSLAEQKNNIYALMILGRSALENKDWKKAITIYNAALLIPSAAKKIDSAIAPLMRYDLALALKHEGYLEASANEYKKYFATPRHSYSSNRVGIQLRFVDQQQAQIYETVGDIYNRLGAPDNAFYFYKKALKKITKNNTRLFKKLVYTYLVLGQAASAQKLVIARLQDYYKSASSDNKAVEMAKYISKQGVDLASLAGALKKTYSDNSQPVELALLIGQILPQQARRQFLNAQLKKFNTDNASKKVKLIFRALVQDYLNNNNLKKALRITAIQAQRYPNNTLPYISFLIKKTADIHSLEQLLTAEIKNKNAANRAGALLIFAAIKNQQGDLPTASDLYRRALAANNKFTVARLQLANIALKQGKPDKALQILKPLNNSEDLQIVNLRLRALVAAGKTKDGLALVNNLLVKNDSVDLAIEKAQLQLRLGLSKQAAKTLQQSLKKRPKNQKLYIALFRLYGSAYFQGDSGAGYQKLMQKMLLNIPHSRVAKLYVARLYAAQGKSKKAIGLLEDILANNSTDISALKSLLSVYQQNNSYKKAISLLDKTISGHPDNKQVLYLAQSFYLQISDTPNLLKVSKNLLDKYAADMPAVLRTAQFYFAAKQYNRAVSLIDKTIKQYHKRIYQPDQFINILWRALVKLKKSDSAKNHIEQAVSTFPNAQGRLLYQLSIFWTMQGEADKSINALKRSLDKNPDYAPANNALGYALAQKGEHLSKAEKLITKALAKDPDNAAYLDSLGWVLYKQGKIKKSLAVFKKIFSQGANQNPIILTHYGDVLLAGGKLKEAIKTLQKALKIYEHNYKNSADPEYKNLDKKIKSQILKASH